jgi:hypothetical protein
VNPADEFLVRIRSWQVVACPGVDAVDGHLSAHASHPL